MNKRDMDHQVRNIFSKYRAVLMCGSFGAIVGGLIGEYVLATINPVLSGIIGAVAGSLLGYIIGFIIKRRTVLNRLSSIDRMVSILAAIFGILIGIGGTATSLMDHDWFSFVASILLAIGGMVMLGKLRRW